MKKNLILTNRQKILLSVFPVFGFLALLFSFFFSDTVRDYIYLPWFLMIFLMPVQNIILVLIIIRKDISFIKKSYCILLNFFIILFQLYYVWYLDDTYVKQKVKND